MARILIIDDDKEMSSLLQDFLEGEGYEAASANDGRAGLRKIARENFDLVLTDIRMPGLTGLDILPEIKKLQPAASVMVITAFGSEEIHHRSMERGANAYVEKPIHFHELRALIDEMLSSKKRRGTEERNQAIE
jgi:DNA-binding response OmpR family regulator